MTQVYGYIYINLTVKRPCKDLSSLSDREGLDVLYVMNTKQIYADEETRQHHDKHYRDVFSLHIERATKDIRFARKLKLRAGKLGRYSPSLWIRLGRTVF